LDDEDDAGNNHFLLGDVMRDVDRFFCGYGIDAEIDREKKRRRKQPYYFYTLFREEEFYQATS
jgi:hypothetical protein